MQDRLLRNMQDDLNNNDVNIFLMNLLNRDRVPSYDEIPEDILRFFAEYLDRSLNEYALSVGEEIARASGASLQELRRVPVRRPSAARIEIMSDTPKWAIRCDIGSATRYEVSTGADIREVWSKIEPAAWHRLAVSNLALSFSTPSPLEKITSELVRICFAQVPQHARYLPAARSGILQLQKTFVGSVVRRYSLKGGVFDQEDPVPTGVITDFLSEMIEMNPTKSGEFADEAAEVEERILQGEMRLQDGRGTSLEPVYHTSSGDYPLARASSMVSELGPVVLYLRHLLRRNEILIIEEPEASLHPGAQIAFARILVHLVNKGLQVVVTTHSEFFLQRINNAIVASGMSADDAAQAGFNPGDTLSGDHVAAYYFDPSSRGTTVNELMVDTVSGISESSFSAVSERLYDEVIALDRGIDSDG
jgi:hypothetical protein